MKPQHKALIAALGVAGMLPLASAYAYDDYARVMHVTPRVEQISEPQQICHTEQYQVQGEHHWFHHDEPVLLQSVEKCQTVDRYTTRTIGYDVTYEYHGHAYTTQTSYDPGPRIRINVDVLPS